MNAELAIAKGKLRDLELQAEQARMAVEEERRHLREATGPIVATHDLDPTRITFLAARLVKAVSDLRHIRGEMRLLHEEYSL